LRDGRAASFNRSRVKIGDIVQGRFRIDRAVGAGGMGTVHRATDLETGAAVALKTLLRMDPRDLLRFEREAELLRSVNDPVIVGYIAHGQDGDMPFLAMEWLEGETLDVRLERGPLAIDEAWSLVHTLARGLAALHSRGVVHRDLKPANVVLTERGARIVDLGIARRSVESLAITGTQAVIGTPLYMAPEQVRSAASADARADVFALGCVLHECLTGTPPFYAETPLAVLARILLETVPSAASLRPDTPAQLDSLLTAMLAKDPDARPEDGGEVALALERGATMPPTVRAISDREARLVACVVARPGIDQLGHTLSDSMPGLATPSLRPVVPTMAGTRTARDGVLAAYLGDGTSIAIVEADEASLAVERALELAQSLLPARIAIAFGRAVGDRVPVGDAIDRALALAHDAGSTEIALDDAVALALDARHVIDRSTTPARYAGRRAAPDPSSVRGRAVPFVGRRRELKALEDHVDASLEDREARALVVVGEAGLGKSRLRRELTTRLAARAVPVPVVVATASPMEAQSPFAALRAIGRAMRASGLEPEHLSETARTAWTDLSVAVPAATDAAAIALLDRADSTTRESAYVSALEGAIRRAGRELVLFVDDAHAIDAASGALLTRLLAVADLGLALVLFGRPEAVDVLGPLLRTSGAATQRLGPFPSAVAQELARAISPDLDPARLSAIVERAGGHALLLEELLRAPSDEEISGAVLTVIERRIARLPADARKVLRAASLFGDRFWRSGVLAAAGLDELRVDQTIGVLRDHELVVDAPVSRYDGERELGFRHALVREAASAMLTDADRALGHRLVLTWLLARGERDEWLLAAHDEKAASNDLERASASDRWYRIARTWPSHSEALHALEHARKLVEGMRTPDDDRLDEIDRSWVFQLAGGPDRAAIAVRMREILADARRSGKRARTIAAMAALVWTLAGLGEIDEALALEAEANALAQGPRDRLTVAKAASMRAFLTNDLEEMARLTEEVVRIADALGKDDDVSSYLHNLGEIHLRKGRLVEGRAVLERSSAIASKYADQRIFSSLNLMLLAYVDAAETGTGGPVEPLRAAIEDLRRGGLTFEELTARVFLGHALARRNEPALAIAEFERAVECATAVGYTRYIDESRAAIDALRAGTIPPLSES
jgi:hypothetical protein